MNVIRNNHISLRIILSLLAITGVARVSSAATLNIGTAQANVGKTEVRVDVDLQVADNEEITSLQFDLLYGDRLKLVDVYAGSVATAADKDVTWNSRSDGVVRVLLYGLNQNVIGNGHVFQLIFDIKSNALAGQSDITAASLFASNPVGDHVSLNGQSGYVFVSGGSATPPSGDDGGG